MIRDVTTNYTYSNEELKAFGQLYSDGLKIGRPHYKDYTAYEIEVSFKNDHEGCLEVFDKIIKDFHFSNSSGLFRQQRHCILF